MLLRKVLPLAAVLALMLTLAGCPGGGGGGGGGAAQAVDVALTDFTIEPDTINVNRGKVTFRVNNTGASVHNFEIVGVPGARTQDLSPGANQNLEATLDQAGTYQVICSVPGHSELGMTATLVVQ